jgi:hypothetical protein
LQPHDLARFGAAINDPAERRRWCAAIMTGGLPMMWRKTAAPVRDLMYAKMELKPGDNVLIIGESLVSCGFLDDIHNLIGPKGTIRSIDVIEQARDGVESGLRGRGGQLSTWPYRYTTGDPDNSYDCVGVIQGVQHCDDWAEAAADLVRVLKPGRMIMLSEIGFGTNMVNAMRLDLHLEYYIEKLCRGAGMSGMDLAYYSPADLRRAFANLVVDPTNFEWRGAELFWARKP